MGWLLFLFSATTPDGVVAGRVLGPGGQVLPGAHVMVPSLRRGTATDLDGSFSLRLPPGHHTLKVSLLGYRDTLLALHLAPAETLHLRITLHPTTLREEPVVVTAQRYETSLGMAPVGVSVRTRENLTLRGGNGLDALEALDLVQADATTRTVANLISIRGASDLRGGGLGNRVLLLWNGRPANLPGTGGIDPSAFPLDALSREEVVYGPHSALYGSHAVGGVIHFLPLSPWNAPPFRLRLGFGDTRPPARWMITSPTLEPPNPWTTGSLLLSGRTARLGGLAFWSVEQDEGFAENRDFLAQRWYAALGLRSGHHEVTAGFAGMVYDGGKPFPWRDVAHPLEVPDAEDGTRQRKHQFNLDLVLRGRAGSLTYRFQPYLLLHHQEDWPRGAPEPQVMVDMSAKGLEAQVEGRSGIHHWIAGLSFRKDSLASEALYGRHSQILGALFVQEEVWLTERQILTLGLRYDASRVDGAWSFSRFTPRLGWIASLSDRVSLRLILAQAFRAPTLAEMFLKRVLVDYLFFVQNPNLKPEVVTSGEGGVEVRLPRTRLVASVFSSFYRDLIDFFPVEGTAGLYRADNRNRARIQGVDLMAETHLFGPFRAELAYEYLDARDAETGEVLAYRPRHQFRGRLITEAPGGRLVLSATYRSRIESAVFDSETPYLPEAFLRWDLRGELRLSPRLFLRGEITNLLNTRYELFARYPTPGRSFRVWMDFSP